MARSNPNHFRTDFCLVLANQVLEDEATKGNTNSNIVVSPLSLHVILSLVAAASKGHTLEQLLFYLGSTSVSDLSLLTSHMFNLTSLDDHEESEVLSAGDHLLLSFVYGAWIDRRFNLKPSFERLVKDHYKAEIRNDIDFVNEPLEAVDEINSWAEKATKGLITKLLPYDSVNCDTALVLANALYFKAKWDKKFDASRTQARNFHLLNGQIVQAPFMTTDSFLGRYHLYKCFDGFKVLQIPYQSGQDPPKFSMYFFLPDAKDGLLNLIQKLKSNPDLLYKKFELTEDKLTDFWIPKFKFSFGFKASDTMRKMGLEKIFNPGELTEMLNIPDIANRKLFVASIFHKSYIEVNEEGTEAAASTAVLFELQRARRYPSFVADYPFLFMIREERHGIVFFVGAVLNPLLDS